MKKLLLFLFLALALTSRVTAGSVITQEVVNVCGFVKGSTTLNLSGQLTPAAMQRISDGNAMAIQNSLDSYLAVPTLLPTTKAGYGTKGATQNVSVSTKNGKFKWTEKDAKAYFAFVTGEESIPPTKAVLKSKGTVDASKLADLETKKLTVLDKLCFDQGQGYLANLVINLQQKGKNYKFSCNENNLKAKVSVNSKGKVTAKYTLFHEAACPAILDEQTFTNKYDLNVTISGKGSVNYEFVGPDEVLVTAIPGEDPFDYFGWDDNISYENPLKLTLTNDTELLVAFKADKEKYMVVDLTTGAISYLEDVPEGGWTDEYKTTKMVLRKVKAGKFTMGSPEGELGRSDNEVQHEVTLTKDFYIAVFQTTQKQYETITGYNPSNFRGDTRPVECVSYNMIRGTDKGAGWPANSDVDEDSFLGKLRTKTSKTFDLPTEAQWEFACRAGTTTALNNGKDLANVDEDDNLNKLGRYRYNGGEDDGTAVVGSYLPNAWGLYDMHGNVWEWCLDWYGKYAGAETDPAGASTGSYRVLRGGSWDEYAGHCRSAYRYYYHPFSYHTMIGFRIVLVQ